MKPKKQVKIFLLLCGFALSLSACGGTKEKLGLVRQAPDEFAVVKRAPLEMPPDYTLRPPQPGVARPQEQKTDAQARQAVFGSSSQVTDIEAGTAESILLERTGATNVDPAIRQVVDQETAKLEPKEKPVAEKLFGWAGVGDKAPATVIDAKAEAERLQRNQAEGKPVTEGETPSIEE